MQTSEHEEGPLSGAGSIITVHCGLSASEVGIRFPRDLQVVCPLCKGTLAEDDGLRCMACEVSYPSA